MAVILEVIDDHRAVVEPQNGVRWTLPMPERTALAVAMKVCVMDTGEKLIVSAGLIEGKLVEVVDDKHAVVEFETGRQLTLRMPEQTSFAAGMKAFVIDTTEYPTVVTLSE